jgi:hypothetical protein
MSLSPAEIEKVKLTASFLNALSSGTILAAIVAPYIGMGMGTVTPSSDLWNLLGLSGFGFVCGIVLHLIARRSLTRMGD